MFSLYHTHVRTKGDRVMQRFFSALPYLRTLRQLGSIAFAAIVALLVACGSGGGGGGGGTPPAAAPSSGVFIDGPVMGLGYSTTSGLSGSTNAAGEFTYRPGDMMTFNLGGRPIGNSVPGAPVITSLQLFGATSIADPRVVNLAQLFLGLGQVVNNVTQLPSTIPAALPNPLNFSDQNFDTILQDAGITLATEAEANAHLQSSFSTVSVTMFGPGSGNVTSNPAGINCSSGTCSAIFVNGNQVTLTPTGLFVGWSVGAGNAVGCNGNTGACTFTLTNNQNLTATFNVPPPSTLSISKTGTGTGIVECSTGGAFTTCDPSYPAATQVTIRATADLGSTFTGWINGTGSVQCSGISNCLVTLNANSTVTAKFELPVPASVTPSSTTANNGGGTVQCSADGGAPGACGSFILGQMITMTADPNIVSIFANWTNATGSATACNGSSNRVCGPFQLITPTTTIVANFNKPMLTVNLVGTGAVTSNVGGINCAPTCSAAIDKGTVVTLSASGTGFTSWSGCTAVIGTPTQCTVTVTADTLVTATFGTPTVSTVPNFSFIAAPGRPLLAINPQSPTAQPTQVKDALGALVTAPSLSGNSGSDAGNPLHRASYSVGSSSFTNLQATTLLFTNGGRIFRASALVSNGVPGAPGNIPVQMSSLTTAQSCGSGSLIDPTNDNPVIGFEDAGGDHICNTGDEFITLMHLKDLDTTAPVTLAVGTKIHDDAQVYDLGTGRLDHGIMVTATDKLIWIDSNLSPADIINGAKIGRVSVVGQTPTQTFLISNTALYIYTPSTHTLTLPAVVTATGGTTLFSAETSFSGRRNLDGTTDATNIYVVQTDGAIYKVPLANPAGVTTLSPPLVGPAFVTAYMTTNKIIIETGTNPNGNNGPSLCATVPSCNNGIIAVAKINGAVTTIEPNVLNKTIYMHHPFDNQVLYTLIDGNVNSGAVRQSETGGGASKLDGSWVGAVQASPLNLVTGLQPMTSAVLETCTNNCQTPATGTVQVITSPTGSPVTIGTVSNTPALSQLPFFSDSTNTALIGFGTLPGSTTGNQLRAPFFVDTTFNSLTPVTTPGLPAQWELLGN